MKKKKIMQKIRTMMKMVTSTSLDNVLPGLAMLLPTKPADAHSVLLSQRSVAGQRKQSPQPRRRSAAGGTLPGIKGTQIAKRPKSKVTSGKPQPVLSLYVSSFHCTRF